jgi:hypothetical protein
MTSAPTKADDVVWTPYQCNSGGRAVTSRHALHVEGGVSMAVRWAIKISLNFEQTCQSHRNGRDFEGFFIHCTRSNDYPWGCGNGFLFIQPFGWIHIIIAWGRKSQKNRVISIWSPHCKVCGDHNYTATTLRIQGHAIPGRQKLN